MKLPFQPDEAKPRSIGRKESLRRKIAIGFAERQAERNRKRADQHAKRTEGTTDAEAEQRRQETLAKWRPARAAYVHRAKWLREAGWRLDPKAEVRASNRNFRCWIDPWTRQGYAMRDAVVIQKDREYLSSRIVSNGIDDELKSLASSETVDEILKKLG